MGCSRRVKMSLAADFDFWRRTGSDGAIRRKASEYSVSVSSQADVKLTFSRRQQPSPIRYAVRTTRASQTSTDPKRPPTLIEATRSPGFIFSTGVKPA